MVTSHRLIPSQQAPNRGDEWCGVPTLIGIAGLFGAVVAAGVAVAAVGIARAIGGRTL